MERHYKLREILTIYIRNKDEDDNNGQQRVLSTCLSSSAKSSIRSGHSMARSSTSARTSSQMDAESLEDDIEFTLDNAPLMLPPKKRHQRAMNRVERAMKQVANSVLDKVALPKKRKASSDEDAQSQKMSKKRKLKVGINEVA